MPILEYECEKCKNIEEVFTPYEKVSPCACGGEMRRAYLTPPAMKIDFSKPVKCQTRGKDGSKPIFTTKHQMNEWGKENGASFVHRDNFEND